MSAGLSAAAGKFIRRPMSHHHSPAGRELTTRHIVHLLDRFLQNCRALLYFGRSGRRLKLLPIIK
jgi:hypothetical protein